MPILFGATEPEAFCTGSSPDGLNTPPVSTNDTRYDSSFSRLAIDARNGVWCMQNLGGISEVWLRWRMGNGRGTNSLIIAKITDASLQPIVLIRQSTSGWRIEYWNGSSYTEGSWFTPSVDGNFIDLHCKIDGMDGRFAWYVGDDLQEEITGDTDLFSATISWANIAGVNSSTAGYISEVLVADEVTSGLRLFTEYVIGNGFHTDWDGDSTDISGTTPGGTPISSDTADELETFALSNPTTFIQDTYSVEAVIQVSRARVGVSGPQNIQHVLRVDGTDYTSSNFPGLTNSYKSGFMSIWDQNPDTTADWQATELVGLQSGVKSIT